MNGGVVDCFEQAIMADPEYILPHYNLACTLNIMRDLGEAVSVNDIVAELIITLNLDPATGGRPAGWAQARINEDPDLRSLKGTQEFGQKINGYKPSRISYSTEKLLCDSAWVHSPLCVGFHEDFTYSEGVGSEGGYRSEGRWKINNDKTIIDVYDKMASFEDLRGEGPSWPEPTTTANAPSYYFDKENMLLFDKKDAISYNPLGGTYKTIHEYRASLKTPVGFSEMLRRKLLIPCNETNYAHAIFSMG